MEKITYLVANYNNGKYLKACVASLNSQTDSNWLCLIADDKSSDDSLEVIASLLSEKIRLLKNERNLGYIGTLKRLIDHASTDIVAILDPDDALYPETTACLLKVYAENPAAGFVYSKRTGFDESLTACLNIRGSEVPPHKTSLQQGFITHVKSFRVSVYRKTAGFDDSMLYAEDRDLVYKLEEVTPPLFIDQVLYKLRRVPNSQSHDKHKKEIGFVNHLRAQKNALQRRGIKGFENFYYRLFFRAQYLLHSDRCPHAFNRFIALYIRMLGCIDDCLKICTTRKLNRPVPEKRIAYYLWRYPVLSETFIQREIAALKQSELAVEVIADGPDNLEMLDAPARALADDTHYLFPLRKTYLLKSLAHFCLLKPRHVFQCVVDAVSKRYQHRKSIAEDIRILLKAFYFAGVLQDKRIDHVHCPWSDVNAFILLLAARLAGIPYSVQARAQEVYRQTAAYALPEKLGHAAFIITNSRFNEIHLQALLRGKKCPPLHVIYEGLPLAQFKPRHCKKNPLKPARLVSVGRLLECKGFVYLLKACKILQQKGYSFRCEIIGSAEEPLYAEYHRRLKNLHRQLALEEQVFFLGAQPFTKVLEAYQRADIFVLPCLTGDDGTQDITPNSLLEAMAMKLPVISTTQTAIPEIVEHGVSGILIPPRDEKALAEAICTLIDDEALRTRLGENARRRIEEKFNIEKNVAKYIDLFSK